MITVYFYFTPGSAASEAMRSRLDSLQKTNPFELASINLERDKKMMDWLQGRDSAVRVGDSWLFENFNDDEFIRQVHINTSEASFGGAGQAAIPSVTRNTPVIQNNSDKLTVWLSKNYIHLFNGLVFIYLGMALLAPVLMKVGLEFPARLIYRFYSITCHQLPYRSWFLFGEQAVYPRDLAEHGSLLTYEQVTGKDPHNLVEARGLLGDEILGYKTALCQRDLAMYGSILLFGIIFALGRKRIPPISWYVWILFGLVPIGIDGLSQLPAAIGGLPKWLPVRESNFVLRTLTGALFGITTAWFLYPQIERSMGDSYRLATGKAAIQPSQNQDAHG